MRQELLPEFKPYQQPVIARDKVRYVGEPIAVVIADSAALAEDALDAIALDIETLPAVADRETAREKRKPAVRGDRPQSHHHAVGGEGRCGSGVPRRALHPPRAFCRAALQRRDHGAARPARRMGRRERPSHRHRHDQGDLPQPPHPGEADGTARGRHHHYRGRCRRRLRRARRVLPRGFPGAVRGARAWPRGEMGRGPPREPDRLEPRSRRRMRAGDRLRARRHDPGPARRGARRSRRLHPHQRRDRGAQHRAGAVRPLSRAEHPFRERAAAHQQDAVRHLSRAGPLRGGLLPRAAVRHGGERSRHRPRRVPPEESRRRARDAVGIPERAAARPGQRDRHRRLPADARPLPRRLRLGGEIEAAGQADRRPPPRHRGRLLSRRRRLRPARERAHGAGERRHRFALHRLVVGRAGRRDGDGADRRRRARHADGAHQPRAARLDHCREAGLRLVLVALDRDGRLGHRAGRGLSQGRDPRRRRQAPAMRAGRRSPSTATTRSGRTAPRSRCRRSPPTASRPKAPIPATSAPTATARTPPMSRSIPAPAMSR